MSQQHWTLIDVAGEICPDSFEHCESLQNPKSGETNFVRVSKRRLRGGVSDNVDVLELENGRLSLTILPTRGMGIWRGRCGDVELKWNSPNFGPVHPALVPLSDPGGLGWLEGFDEWLVRCGLESNGSPEFDAEGRLVHPLHGRIANLPTRHLTLAIDRQSGKIEIRGKVYETKLFFKKLELETTLTTFVGSSEFTVRDKITNLSAQPGEFELLYHINTGQPFAAPGGRVVVPFDRMAPRSEAAVRNLPNWDTLCPETPGSDEVVFFFEPAGDENGICKTMLVDPAGARGLALSFDKNSFPYFSFWKSRLADADGYVCGLEPSVNFPNQKSFEKQHGRVVPLEPGEFRTFELNFEILHDADSVRETEEQIRSIEAARVVDAVPRKEWTP